jgi:arylsulfatase A-like enzyme
MVDKVRQYLANTQDRKTEEDWFAPRLFTRGMEYLEQAGEGQPFFLVLDSFDPHEPWDPPEKYVSLYSDGYVGRDPIVPNYGPSDWISDQGLERMKALYSGEVTMVDRWFGHFLDKMESTGRMEDTLLLVLADHGVALGEHGFTGKPFGALWPELTDIPFFIRHPDGKGAGPHFTLGYDRYVWARDEKYVMFGMNDRSKPRLYDLESDPDMYQNIARDNPDVVKRMFNRYILEDAGGSLPRV